MYGPVPGSNTDGMSHLVGRFISLVTQLTPKRQCSCAHFSGLIILLANMSLNPGHELVAFDQHLALRAINLFDKLLDIIEDDGFKALRLVVGELSQKATLAVETHRLESAKSDNIVFESLSADVDALQPIELEFLPQDTNLDGVDGPFGEFDVNGFQDSVFGQTYNATDLRGIPAIADLDDFLR